jgi:hypothetical protein
MKCDKEAAGAGGAGGGGGGGEGGGGDFSGRAGCDRERVGGVRATKGGTHTHTHTFPHKHEHTHTQTRTHTDTHTHTHTHTHVCSTIRHTNTYTYAHLRHPQCDLGVALPQRPLHLMAFRFSIVQGRRYRVAAIVLLNRSPCPPTRRWLRWRRDACHSARALCAWWRRHLRCCCAVLLWQLWSAEAKRGRCSSMAHTSGPRTQR